MNQGRTGKSYILIGVGVVVLVLLVGVSFMNRGGSSSSTVATNTQAQTQAVVFAAQSIPQGTTLKEGEPLDTYFTVRQVPLTTAPLGAYSSVDQIENVIKGVGCQPRNQPGCTGQITTTQTIYQNLPVVSGMFSTLGPYRSSATPAFKIPYGYVAVSLDLTGANAVSGSIQAGDTIDLMASYTGNGEKANLTAPSQTQYIMTNVKVIGIGTLPAPDASGATTTTTTTQSSGTTSESIVILARYQQALVIQHLKDFGWQLSAVLRSARATSAIPHFKTVPVTDRWFFAKSSNPFRTNPGY